MKKIEAKQIAPEKSKVIIEYISQILSDNKIVNAKMNFSSAKIDNQMMCTLDIYVPEANFEKHINLGITSDHSLVLCDQFLNDLLDKFLEHESIGVTKYYSVKSSSQNFSGIDAINLQGSRLKINLNESGQEFNNIISLYQARYEAYEESIKSTKAMNR